MLRYDLEGICCGLVKALFLHLPGRIKEKQEKSESRQQAIRPDSKRASLDYKYRTLPLQSRSVACEWYISLKSRVSPTLRVDNLMRTVQVEGWKMSGVRLGVINNAWGKFLRFLPQDEVHRKLEFPCRQNREIHYKLVNASEWRKPYRHEVGLMTGIYLTRYLSGRTLIFRWDSKMNSGI